jgi:hypothetical protein
MFYRINQVAFFIFLGLLIKSFCDHVAHTKIDKDMDSLKSISKCGTEESKLTPPRFPGLFSPPAEKNCEHEQHGERKNGARYVPKKMKVHRCPLPRFDDVASRQATGERQSNPNEMEVQVTERSEEPSGWGALEICWQCRRIGRLADAQQVPSCEEDGKGNETKKAKWEQDQADGDRSGVQQQQ